MRALLWLLAVEVSSVFVRQTGYLLDIYCVERDRRGQLSLDGFDMQAMPHMHTVHCMRDIKVCSDSGFGLWVPKAGGVGYDLLYTLDSAANAQAFAWLRQTPDTLNVLVTISGEATGSSIVVSSLNFGLCFHNDTFCLKWEPKNKNTEIAFTLTSTRPNAGAGWVMVGFPTGSTTFPANTITCWNDGTSVAREEGVYSAVDQLPTRNPSQLSVLGRTQSNTNLLSCTVTRPVGSAGGFPITDSTIPFFVAQGPLNGTGPQLPLVVETSTVNFISPLNRAGPRPTFAVSAMSFVLMYILIGALSILGLSALYLFPNTYDLMQKRLCLDATIGEWMLLFVYVVPQVSILIVQDTPIAFGMLTGLNLACLLLPVTRRSLWVHVFGVPFDRAIKFHRWVARVTVALMIVHGGLMIGTVGSFVVSFLGRPTIPIFGLFAGILMIIMLITAYETVRRKRFELFWYTHNLFFLVVICAMIHTTVNIYTLIGPLILVLLDWAIRIFGGTRNFQLVSATTLPDKVTRLQLKKPARGFTYEPGQYAFIRIPSISKFEVHPFSISSSPDHDSEHITFHIKDMGKGQFTNRLNELASKGELKRVDVMGPYGRVGLPKQKELDLAVLIAGGIGITPMVSLALHYRKHAKKTVLIWSNHGSQCFTAWFEVLTQSHEGLEILRYDTSPPPVSRPSQEHLATQETEPAHGVRILNGRPAYAAIINERKTSNALVVLACGPAPMVADVQTLCANERYWFHKRNIFTLEWANGCWGVECQTTQKREKNMH